MYLFPRRDIHRAISKFLLFMFISKYFIIKIKTYIFVYR